MKLYLHDHPAAVTAEELARDLLMLPPWRREKALSYHFLIDRVLCTKAYLLLCQGLHECYGIDCHPSSGVRPCNSPEFAYVGNGKPVLKDYPHIHFNISHCHRGVLVAIDDRPIGCDIEEIAPTLDLDLCRHCFNDSEIADIVASPVPSATFTSWWTRKEAVLKLTGEGIDDNLPELFNDDSFYSNVQAKHPLDQFQLQTVTDREHSFVYTVCQYAP